MLASFSAFSLYFPIKRRGPQASATLRLSCLFARLSGRVLGDRIFWNTTLFLVCPKGQGLKSLCGRYYVTHSTSSHRFLGCKKFATVRSVLAERPHKLIPKPTSILNCLLFDLKTFQMQALGRSIEIPWPIQCGQFLIS